MHDIKQKLLLSIYWCRVHAYGMHTFTVWADVNCGVCMNEKHLLQPPWETETEHSLTSGPWKPLPLKAQVNVWVKQSCSILKVGTEIPMLRAGPKCTNNAMVQLIHGAEEHMRKIADIGSSSLWQHEDHLTITCWQWNIYPILHCKPMSVNLLITTLYRQCILC